MRRKTRSRSGGALPFGGFAQAVRDGTKERVDSRFVERRVLAASKCHGRIDHARYRASEREPKLRPQVSTRARPSPRIAKPCTRSRPIQGGLLVGAMPRHGLLHGL